MTEAANGRPSPFVCHSLHLVWLGQTRLGGCNQYDTTGTQQVGSYETATT